MSDDQALAADAARARSLLDRAGAAGLERRPWQHAARPTSDGELVRFAVWSGRDAAGSDPAVIEAGLRLLAPARAELDQVEAGLLFAARGAGMTWSQIADALGLGSAQAAHQRLNRVTHRVTPSDTES